MSEQPNLFEQSAASTAPQPPRRMETDTVEWKQSWQEDCLKELAALANTHGGTLYVGIDDDGQTVGWQGNGDEEAGIANKIVDTLRIHPVKLAIEQIDSLPVLVIEMARAASPVALRQRYYRRVGSTSREVPPEDLARFLLERTGQTWDAQPSEYDLASMEQATIDDFRVLGKQRLPEMSPSDTAEAILNKLKLILPDGRLKRAALLLFGRDPQRLATTAQIQVGRFKDDETILDDKRIEGNLFEQLVQTEQALRNSLFIRYDFPTGQGERVGVEALQREEVWEFPYKAVREALLNALIHRDYASTGRVQVRVYDDRMTITNPGGLPAGLTVSDLLREPHDSLPRNPILAQVCYYARLVEQWGSGTIRMRNACRKQGLPDPVFASTPTNFSVTLRSDDLSDERLRLMGMNPRQIQAVHFVRQNQSISTGELQTLVGAARRTAARDLDQLVEQGILDRSTTSGRAVRYTLAKRNG